MENIELQIENYLLGNMSPEERGDFEKFISENSNAKSELEMQKLVLEAIKQTRRLELKTKLAGINPSSISPWTQKIAIAAVSALTVTLVGITMYTSINNNLETPKKVSKSSISITSNSSPISQKEVKQVESEIEIIDRAKTSAQIIPKVNKSKPSVGKNNIKSTESIRTIKKTDKFDPLVYAEDEEDIEYSFNNGTIESSKNNNEIHSSKIDYSVDKGYDFLGYKYDGKNLQLLGNFKGEAYIVEKKLGMLLLRYQGKIYKIVESNNKEERLEDHQISDLKVLNQLQ